MACEWPCRAGRWPALAHVPEDVLENGEWRLGLWDGRVWKGSPGGSTSALHSGGPLDGEDLGEKVEPSNCSISGPGAALTTSSHKRAVLANELQRVTCGRGRGRGMLLLPNPQALSLLGTCCPVGPNFSLSDPPPSLLGGPGNRAKAPKRRSLLLPGGGWGERGRQASRSEH